VYGANSHDTSIPKEQLLNTNTYFRPVVNKIIRLGIEDEKLTLYKNKLCFRDYLHIYDLINALVLAGLQKSTEKRYYTLGCGSRSTIEDVWNIIAEYLGGIPIEYNDKALSDMETRSFTSDYTQFKDLTGWNPKYTLRFGIKESIEQIKKVLNDSTF
jgi:nucleoside-diphosphate-sugar epimerase